MPLAEQRAELARQQAELVRTLVAGGAPLPDFDAQRLQAAARSLALKRRHELAHSWPGLVEGLGADFDRLYRSYAVHSPRPRHGGPLADGRAFARFLAAQGQLSDGGKLEALLVDAQYASGRAGWTRRRGAWCRVVYLRSGRALVVAVRWPWLGVRWWRVPLGWPR